MKRRWLSSTASSILWLGARKVNALVGTRPHCQNRRFRGALGSSLSSYNWKSMDSTTANTDNIGSTPSEWTVCSSCRGQGRLNRRPARKAQNRSESAGGQAPSRPIQVCKPCEGSGLRRHSDSDMTPPTSRTFPRVAIIGGGLAGLALATACRHRGISCRVFERDKHFLDRSQGYGLTLQQASKALIGFGIESLSEGIISTKHVVHKTDGTVVGEWGFRQWGRSSTKKEPKRQNVHIARQALRYELLHAAGGHDAVQWNHKLVSFKEEEDHVSLTFQVGDTLVEERTDLLVGADGIRSAVREQWIGNATPLRYLDCMVLLGICPKEALHDLESDLLDGATVFQTADGETRIYMMPYSSNEYMWQLSFPLDEATAKDLSQKGSSALKVEALSRCKAWHLPVPQVLEATPERLVSGYPVYDRTLMTMDMMKTKRRITLIGDACHPMSPFKGQGANQALLDALQLARTLYSVNDADALGAAMEVFEREMLDRSAVKVQASAKAAQFLHSEIAIQEGNVTRGAAAASTADDSKTS